MKVNTVWIKFIAAATAIVVCAAGAPGALASSMAITEWTYTAVGGPGEYFELTNLSNAPINMAGWSQDDSNRTAGKHDLSGFGTVAPGESVIGTEGTDAAAFRTYWNLPNSVKVIAYGSSDNLGRADEINLYDNASPANLIDRLTYDDQTIGGPRAQGTSANIALPNIGSNHANLAVASSLGDIYHSFKGGGGSGDLGNPGFYPNPVPEPASITLALGGALLTAGLMPRNRRS